MPMLSATRSGLPFLPSSGLKPFSAARRIDLGLNAPIHSGGCGFWIGAGSTTMSSK
jgi:hypothetical protein